MPPLEPFQRKGYDVTTIEEIADVSSRTFSRYFVSEEDAALAPLDRQYADVLAALARP